MSTLTLVRHGQATPFQKVTDTLSPLGEQQAMALASHWLRIGREFDAVYTGTLVRQMLTEAAVRDAMHALGRSWPQAQATAGWNEYGADGILNLFVPELARRDERFAALVQSFEAARGTPDQNRHFQRMFEVTMKQWLEAGVEVEGVEPFHSFQNRVLASWSAIQAQAGSRRVAVFTSGGPIGLMVQHALKAPARSFLEVNWRVRNASLTEFVYSSDRLSLDSFNSTSHLDPEIVSFR